MHGALIAQKVRHFVVKRGLKRQNTASAQQQTGAREPAIERCAVHGKRNVPSTIVTDGPPIHVLPAASS